MAAGEASRVYGVPGKSSSTPLIAMPRSSGAAEGPVKHHPPGAPCLVHQSACQYQALLPTRTGEAPPVSTQGSPKLW